MGKVIITVFTMTVILLSGDVFGLSIYYLSHINKWHELGITRITLLIMISIITAIMEATRHTPVHGNEQSRYQRYTQAFFFSILVSLLLTYKPL